MADVYRYLYGENNPVKSAFKTGIAVQVGDLCYLDSADSFTVKPANVIAWDLNLGQTQVDFVASFIGVSGQRYDGVNVAIGIKDGFLRIDTEGVFLFACAAGSSFNQGTLVGPDQAAGGVLQLQSQQVVLVGNKANAIGRVEEAVSNASSVKVRIFTTKLGVINN